MSKILANFTNNGSHGFKLMATRTNDPENKTKNRTSELNLCFDPGIDGRNPVSFQGRFRFDRTLKANRLLNNSFLLQYCL